MRIRGVDEEWKTYGKHTRGCDDFEGRQ